MNKFIVLFVATLVLVGCQKKESTQQPNQRQEMSRKLIIKSLADLQNKDLKSAVTSLEASIKINPSDPEAYLLLAQVLLKVGEYAHAAEFLEQSAKVFPENGSIFYMLSASKRMLGQKLPAVLAARRSVEIYHDQKDRDNMISAAALLQDLINTPDDKFVPVQGQGEPLEKIN